MCKRRKNVKIQQGDGSIIKGGKYIANTRISIKTQEVSNLITFVLDAEVLDIGPWDVIVGLSWLMENNIVVDTSRRMLSTDKDTIKCREHQISVIFLLTNDNANDDANDGANNDTNDDILPIIDAKDRYAYAQAFSSE